MNKLLTLQNLLLQAPYSVLYMGQEGPVQVAVNLISFYVSPCLGRLPERTGMNLTSRNRLITLPLLMSQIKAPNLDVLAAIQLRSPGAQFRL